MGLDGIVIEGDVRTAVRWPSPGVPKTKSEVWLQGGGPGNGDRDGTSKCCRGTNRMRFLEAFWEECARLGVGPFQVNYPISCSISPWRLLVGCRKRALHEPNPPALTFGK